MRQLAEDAVALAGEASLGRFGEDLAAWAGFRPAECTPHLIKRSDRRLVVRYELSNPTQSMDVVGKWYATDRGRLVYDLLQHLRTSGFGGSDGTLPAPAPGGPRPTIPRPRAPGTWGRASNSGPPKGGARTFHWARTARS